MARLNLDYYKGQDLYTDGEEIENKLLEIVRTTTDFTNTLYETTEVIDITNYDYFKEIATEKSNERWPILYHLSPVRRNLLEWYPFETETSLLEIGGGCGALTGMFAEKVRSVTVVELSKKRSDIIYERHKNIENIEIFTGNFNDIKFNKLYDYVTMIGVLEYAGKFTDGKNPYKKFLSQARSLLKPGGILILAIENKFGMKYWAGAREDHTGRPFDSIENYPGTDAIKTFSKFELSELLTETGFSDIKYYYPMPDYKLPKIIYSDDYLPDSSSVFHHYTPNYDQERYKIFRENLAYLNVIKSSMFDFFANSYLVLCR